MAKKNSNPSTKIVCPVCGTEFAITEKTHVAIGIVVGADSGLGTIYPATTGATQTPTPVLNLRKKTTEKIEALRKAGVNVDNLFSMKSASGQEIIARMENGNLSVVPDNDPIFAAIMGHGTVPNRRLFRRWVMAQVFHMLNYKSYRGSKTGFVAALEAKGYKYQWKMVLEEMRVQAKLAAEDPENFALRNRWFNDSRIMQMGIDYLEQLAAHINKLKVRHCKGVPYVKLGGRNVFTADIQTKVIDPIVKAMAKIGEADSPQKLYSAVNAAVRLIQQWWFTNDACVSQAFKDAYKGAGAYFTMQNLVLFHGASFKNGCIKLGQKKSLAMLENKANEYAASQEGWRLFGVMKKLIADSGINIKKKMEEWRK